MNTNCTMSCVAILILSLFATTMLHANAFTPSNRQVRTVANNVSRTCTSLSMVSETTNAKKTTLTDETTWRLRLLLNDVTTTKGKKLDGKLFVVEGKFIEEEGYEPPQGLFKPTVKVSSSSEDDETKESGMTFEVTNSRWKLSEDPDDRKDGLWIWGLFKEPLYPYMLFQMETNECKLSSSNDVDDNDSIPPLKLYARIDHIRDRDGENGVELKTANLNVRILEQVQLPGATVDLFEEEAVGQVSFQPL